MPVKSLGGAYQPTRGYNRSGSSDSNGTYTSATLTGTTTIGAGATITSPTLASPSVSSPTLTLTAAALVALGTNQATAAPIVSPSGAFIHATAADGTVGIRLPAATAGQIFIIKNSDAANAVLKIYPASSDAINALAANASLDIAAKTSVILVALDATTWYTVPLLPS
jgi:hypothetical protein